MKKKKKKRERNPWLPREKKKSLTLGNKYGLYLFGNHNYVAIVVRVQQQEAKL